MAYNQITSLIRLIDDESSVVRTEVAKKIFSYGPNIYKEIEKDGIVLSSPQKEILSSICEGMKKSRLQNAWLGWQKLPESFSQLEFALVLLSEYLSPIDEFISIKVMLDKLAEEYREIFPTVQALTLAKFLFQQKALKGNERDYYNPQNSNLSYVLQRKKGIPISLACVYMLVGKRLGLHIEGCHFPGHFLARVDHNNRKVFVDCFNEGLLLTEADIMRIRRDKSGNLKKILYEKIDVTIIVKRVLANLIRALGMRDEKEKSEFMIGLFKQLEERALYFQLEEGKLDPTATKMPLFHHGQIVRHTRYAYRGIIVDVDKECRARDDWYYANQTQPDRNQAWYHVLVNDSDQISYVAESNLQSDQSLGKIVHPLLVHFFTETTDGKYRRNNTPWPKMNH